MTKAIFSIPEASHRTLGILALVMVALILGSIPVALKEALVHFSPSVQFAVRFAIASLLFVPFVREFNINLLRDGAIVGLAAFGCVACETIGLETVSANRASFMIGLNVVFVTLFELLFRRRISVRVILAAGLAFGGIGMMTWDGEELVVGNLWLIGCALCDAAAIILLEKFAPRHSPISLTATRLWTVAILGFLWAAPELTQPINVPLESWIVLVYLGVVTTALVCLLYTIGLRWVPSYEAALFLALEPVFGAVIAFFLLGETFGIWGFVGAAMVLSGMVLVLRRGEDDDSQESAPLSAQGQTPQLTAASSSEVWK